MYGLHYYVNSPNLEQPGDVIRGYLKNVIGFIIFSHKPRITTKFTQLLHYQVVLCHWKYSRLLCEWYLVRKNNHISGMKINMNHDNDWFWVDFWFIRGGLHLFAIRFLFPVSLRQAIPESKRNAKKTFGDGVCCELLWGESIMCKTTL